MTVNQVSPSKVSVKRNFNLFIDREKKKENNNELKYAVGTFATRTEAETALRKLRDADFNMDKVSVIASNVEPEENFGGAEVKPTSEQAKVGATAGAATGGILGLIIYQYLSLCQR